jgi:hypothetical protein
MSSKRRNGGLEEVPHNMKELNRCPRACFGLLQDIRLNLLALDVTCHNPYLVYFSSMEEVESFANQ